MKIPLLTALALAGSLPVLAQQNRVSIGIGTLASSSNLMRSSVYESENKYDYLFVVPTIGYYRMLKNGTGVCVELGYGRQRISSDSKSPGWYPGSGITSYSAMDVTTDELVVSPNLFTVITSPNRRFRFVPSLSIPVSYVANSSNRNDSWLVNDSTGDVFSKGRTESPRRNAFSVGVMLGGSALCRLGGNLYAGVNLGTGFRFESSRTKGELVGTYNVGEPSETRTTTPVDMKQQAVSFLFQPAVVLNYFF